jgi:hypothetical protein
MGIDESLELILQYCTVIEHEGDNVLITDDGFTRENDAYAWVAQCSMVLLAIRAGWEEAPYQYASDLAAIDEIAAIWSTEYQTFVVSIPVWEIVENFNDPDYLEEGGGDLLADLMSYIDYYGDVSPLSMY